MAKSYDEILLETDEEVTSAIEKIKKSKSSNIALVLPRSAVLGQSIVNLKLVFRQAAEMDKTVAIVSPDRVTRNLADRVGFSVVESISEIRFADNQKSGTSQPKSDLKDVPTSNPAEIAKKRFDTASSKISEPKDESGEFDTKESESDEPKISNYRQPDRDPNENSDEDFEQAEERVAKAVDVPHKGGGMIPTRGSLRMYRNQKKRPLLIMSAVLVGVGVVALATVAVVVPSAQVTLTVEAQPFTDRITSAVSTEAQSLDIEKGLLPGKEQPLSLTTKVSAKATGTKDQGEKATGTITVLNVWDSLVHSFPAGTTVTAKNGKQYLTKTDVTVGGATSTIAGGTSVITPGQKDVSVVAAEPGNGSNVGATTFTIPSLPKAQQDKIYATSSAAITGGTSNIVAVVTADDITKLTDTAKLQNKTEAVAKYKADFPDQVVLEKAMQTTAQDVTTNVPVDTVSDSIEVAVAGTFSLITFTEANQRELVQKLVSTKIPQDQTLVTSGDGIDVDTSQFEVNLVTPTKIELINTIKAFTVNGFDQNQIRRLLVAAKPNSDTVVNLTKAKIPVQKAEIKVSPVWWPRLPLWSEKIKLNLQFSGKEA